jgi:hypothetical protein
MYLKPSAPATARSATYTRPARTGTAAVSDAIESRACPEMEYQVELVLRQLALRRPYLRAVHSQSGR